MSNYYLPFEKSEQTLTTQIMLFRL